MILNDCVIEKKKHRTLKNVKKMYPCGKDKKQNKQKQNKNNTKKNRQKTKTKTKTKQKTKQTNKQKKKTSATVPEFC